jgi:putative inorganic carbon (HCO3(-)) transporter
MLVYLWFALMRPDILAWSDGAHPYSLALLICTLIGMVLGMGAELPSLIRIFKNPFTIGLIVLAIPTGLSVFFGVFPKIAWDDYSLFLRVIGTSMLIPVLIRSEEQVRSMILVMAVSLGVIGCKFGIWGVINGGVHITGGYGGMMSDNNNTALAFVMGVPLCWGASQLTDRRWLKYLLYFMIANLLIGIVMTESRGAAVSLAVVLSLMCLLSKQRFLALVCLTGVLAGAIYMVQDTYVERIQTLQDPTQETSAESRIVYAQAALEIWQDYPLLGVGFGGESARLMQPKYIPGMKDYPSYIHNTYLEYLAGSGIFGAIVYVVLLFGTLGWLALAARRAERIRPGLGVYPRCMCLSLLGFVIGSTFLSRQLFDLCFILICAAGSWYLVERQLQSEVVYDETQDESGLSFDLSVENESPA